MIGVGHANFGSCKGGLQNRERGVVERLEAHRGGEDDRSQRDPILEAVEALIEEANASPRTPDELRLPGLLELRARLLSAKRRGEDPK